MALSETVFICLILLFLFSALKYRDTQERRCLIVMALGAGLAVTTRYLGIVLSALGLLVVAFSGRRGKMRLAADSIVFLLIALAPLAAWWIRNWQVTGTLMGPRATSSYTLPKNLSLALDVFLRWFFPGRMAEHRSLLVLVSAVIGYLLGTLGADFLARALDTVKRGWPIISFAAIYLVALLLSASHVAFDQINNRLLSPIYLPVLIVVVSLIPALLAAARTRWPPRLSVVALIGAVLLIIGMGGATGASLMNWHQHGAGGLNTDVWHQSELITYLRQHPPSPNVSVYSNAPWALRALAGIPSAQLSPQKKWYQSEQIRITLEELQASWPTEEGAFFVWSELQYSPHFYTVDELQTVAEFRPIVRLIDGAVYEIVGPKD